MSFYLFFRLHWIRSRKKSANTFYKENNFKPCLIILPLNVFKFWCEWGIREGVWSMITWRTNWAGFPPPSFDAFWPGRSWRPWKSCSSKENNEIRRRASDIYLSCIQAIRVPPQRAITDMFVVCLLEFLYCFYFFSGVALKQSILKSPQFFLRA